MYYCASISFRSMTVSLTHCAVVHIVFLRIVIQAFLSVCFLPGRIPRRISNLASYGLLRYSTTQSRTCHATYFCVVHDHLNNSSAFVSNCFLLVSYHTIFGAVELELSCINFNLWTSAPCRSTARLRGPCSHVKTLYIYVKWEPHSPPPVKDISFSLLLFIAMYTAR